MAQYDGSIRINTNINTKGAKESLVSLAKAIVGTADRISSLKAKMDALKDQKTPTEEYKALDEYIKQTETSIGNLTESLRRLEGNGLQDSDVYRDISATIEEMNAELQQSRARMQELVDTGKAFELGSDSEEYRNLQKEIENEEFALRKLIAQYRVLNTVENVRDGFQRLGSIAKKAFSAMIPLIKRATSSMLGFGKSTKASNNAFQTGFKNILKYGLGIRSLYALVNKLRTAIKEGFSNMAKEVDSFKVKVDGLKASTLTLKNSFAAAFRPLVEIALPYIQMVTDAMTNLLDTVGQFMAAITGQKAYTKAIRQTTAAIEDENKAQNKQLSGLDKLNNLSSESGGGADGGASTQMFEENVPISSSITDAFQKIKDLVESEDWKGIGEYIADSLNAGLQKVYEVLNWDTVAPKVTYFTSAFANALNGLVDGFDWTLFGQTIGAGINTAVNTLSLLISGIDWTNLGNGLAAWLNGLAGEVDFTNVGNLIGQKFMIVPNIAIGFVKSLDWSAIGTSIANALNGIVSSIDLSSIGTALGIGLTGIFQSAINFSATFDWKGLGTNIYEGINSFFANTDWATVGQGISDFVLGLLDSLITVIEGTDWQQIGESIKTFISNIDWGGLAERLAEGIGAILGGLAALLWGLIKDAWDSVIGWWEENAFEDGKFTITGLLNGILEAIKNIGTWIKEHIFNPFIEGFKKAFGIHSPSTVMAEMGKYIIQGLLNGIKSLVDSVKAIWEAMKNTAISIWNSVKDRISNIVNGIKQAVETALNTIKNTWNTVWNTVKGVASNVWNGIKTTISTVINGIKFAISTALNIIKTTWNAAWTGMKTTVINIFSGIWSGIKGVINSILGGIEKMANGVVNGINIVIGALNNLSFDIPDWIPAIGGKTFGFDIPKLSQVSIPRLATGAVIPANREFLAVLGDQKHGTNIEAPLDTIKQAVREELSSLAVQGSGGDIEIHLTVECDGYKLLQLIQKLDREQFARTQRPSFQM